MADGGWRLVKLWSGREDLSVLEVPGYAEAGQVIRATFGTGLVVEVCEPTIHEAWHRMKVRLQIVRLTQEPERLKVEQH